MKNLMIIIGIVVATLSSCKKEEVNPTSTQPQETTIVDTVYVNNNCETLCGVVQSVEGKEFSNNWLVTYRDDCSGNMKSCRNYTSFPPEIGTWYCEE